MTTSTLRRRSGVRLTPQQKRRAIDEMRRRRDAAVERDVLRILLVNR